MIVSPSGRRYVGSSRDIRTRWASYKEPKMSRQPLLLKSFKKYGVLNHKFSVLFECDLKDVLFFERVFGDMYLSLADFGGLNVRLPGCDDVPTIYSKDLRMHRSNKAKERMSCPERREKQRQVALKQVSDPFFKKRMGEATREWFKNPENVKKQSEQAKRFHGTVEARKANSERAKLRMSDPIVRAHTSNKMKDYYNTNPDVLQKAREVANILNSNKWFNPRSKKVVNTISGQIFANAKDAANDAGMTYDNFKNRLNGGVSKVESINYVYYEPIKQSI